MLYYTPILFRLRNYISSNECQFCFWFDRTYHDQFIQSCHNAFTSDCLKYCPSNRFWCVWNDRRFRYSSAITIILLFRYFVSWAEPTFGAVSKWKSLRKVDRSNTRCIFGMSLQHTARGSICQKENTKDIYYPPSCTAVMLSILFFWEKLLVLSQWQQSTDYCSSSWHWWSTEGMLAHKAISVDI